MIIGQTMAANIDNIFDKIENLPPELINKILVEQLKLSLLDTRELLSNPEFLQFRKWLVIQ